MRLAPTLAALLLVPSLSAASPPLGAACRRGAARLDRLEAAAEQPPVRRRLQAQLARLTGALQDRCVRLNEIQVIGTHNSYHVEARPALMAALLAFDRPLFETLQYSHPPLDQQLDALGIRQIELDVFADPQGGLFARRGGLLAIGEDPDSGLPELEAPGLKVLHVQDIDFETTCLTFRDCLGTVKTWSDAHPRHLPIMILVEAKDDVIPDIFGFGFAVPIPIGPAELDTIDAEIRSVFPEEQLITPDAVRGRHATLAEAVLADGWPALGRARGRVLFTLDNGGGVRAAYRGGRRSLEGRVMFVDASPGDDDAAFVKENDPLADPLRIPSLVQAGYVVRTRADADTVQSRTGDTTQRDIALASGAQWVSTDYERPDPRFTDYQVTLPGGAVARCNPVSRTIACRDDALEPAAP